MQRFSPTLVCSLIFDIDQSLGIVDDAVDQVGHFACQFATDISHHRVAALPGMSPDPVTVLFALCQLPQLRMLCTIRQQTADFFGEFLHGANMLVGAGQSAEMENRCGQTPVEQKKQGAAQGDNQPQSTSYDLIQPQKDLLVVITHMKTELLQADVESAQGRNHLGGLLGFVISTVLNGSQSYFQPDQIRPGWQGRLQSLGHKNVTPQLFHFPFQALKFAV